MRSIHFSDVNIHYRGDVSEVWINKAYGDPPAHDFPKAETSIEAMAKAALRGEELVLADDKGGQLTVSADTVRQAVGGWALDKEQQQLENVGSEDVFSHDRLVTHIRQWATGSAETKSVTTDDSWHDAGLEVWHAWDRFSSARTPIETADAIVALSNAMSMLATFLPGYDYGTGTVVDPDDEPDAPVAGV